ncbi:PAAR-like protein [Fangia hongkongensis]|uniref:PAAR-like protein n=1 Tax=Fangia hongkongensis TaxID=270495 RepID=UPI00036AF074|nr:PAAR-like protein [Fangia hongkongensis]MBK2124348.1 DUF4280 domain-containing protein [Fangia hongkongensis]
MCEHMTYEQLKAYFKEYDSFDHFTASHPEVSDFKTPYYKLFFHHSKFESALDEPLYHCPEKEVFNEKFTQDLSTMQSAEERKNYVDQCIEKSTNAHALSSRCPLAYHNLQMHQALSEYTSMLGGYSSDPEMKANILALHQPIEQNNLLAKNYFAKRKEIKAEHQDNPQKSEKLLNALDAQHKERFSQQNNHFSQSATAFSEYDKTSNHGDKITSLRHKMRTYRNNDREIQNMHRLPEDQRASDKVIEHKAALQRENALLYPEIIDGLADNASYSNNHDLKGQLSDLKGSPIPSSADPVVIKSGIEAPAAVGMTSSLNQQAKISPALDIQDKLLIVDGSLAALGGMIGCCQDLHAPSALSELNKAQSAMNDATNIANNTNFGQNEALNGLSDQVGGFNQQFTEQVNNAGNLSSLSTDSYTNAAQSQFDALSQAASMGDLSANELGNMNLDMDSGSGSLSPNLNLGNGSVSGGNAGLSGGNMNISGGDFSSLSNASLSSSSNVNFGSNAKDQFASLSNMHSGLSKNDFKPSFNKGQIGSMNVNLPNKPDLQNAFGSFQALPVAPDITMPGVNIPSFQTPTLPSITPPAMPTINTPNLGALMASQLPQIDDLCGNIDANLCDIALPDIFLAFPDLSLSLPSLPNLNFLFDFDLSMMLELPDLAGLLMGLLSKLLDLLNMLKNCFSFDLSMMFSFNMDFSAMMLSMPNFNIPIPQMPNIFKPQFPNMPSFDMPTMNFPDLKGMLSGMLNGFMNLWPVGMPALPSLGGALSCLNFAFAMPKFSSYGVANGASFMCPSSVQPFMVHKAPIGINYGIGKTMITQVDSLPGVNFMPGGLCCNNPSNPNLAATVTLPTMCLATFMPYEQTCFKVQADYLPTVTEKSKLTCALCPSVKLQATNPNQDASETQY